MLGKFTSALAIGFVLSGCATSAPDIPRQTRATIDPGYEPRSLIDSRSETSQTASSEPSLPIIHVSELAWSDLEEIEKESIQKRHTVHIHQIEKFGRITDVQTIDQSTPATNSGAILGSTVASVGYIDHAFGGGNNYSAGAHLAIGLLGALIGSSLDKAATKQFQTRYAVQLGDGEVQYFDEVKSDAFRHAVGVCVHVPEIKLAAQNLCNQNTETIKKKFLSTDSLNN